jgi:hypothetical protein
LDDPRTSLDGPTNLGPTIDEAASRARALQSNEGDVMAYMVLLILTDGDVSDKKETIDSIIAATNLPLSIIMIGVGDDNFEFLEKLDGDDEVLVGSSKMKAQRDIVQFVPFRKFRTSTEDLAAEVLHEIPRQFMEYVKLRNIPAPPLPSPQVLEQARKKREAMQNELVTAYSTTVATWNINRSDQ